MGSLDFVNRSVDDLELTKTPYPEFDSGLNLTIYRSRTKPIKDLSCDELRIALDHRVGLDFIIPYVLSTLEVDVFNDGGLYDGALLRSFLLIPTERWSDISLVLSTELLMNKFLFRMIEVNPKELKHGFPAVMGAYSRFREKNMAMLISLETKTENLS